jgi:hypothetical protein
MASAVIMAYVGFGGFVAVAWADFLEVEICLFETRSGTNFWRCCPRIGYYVGRGRYMALLIRVFFCIFVFGCFLYRHIDHQNALTKLQIEFPILSRESRRIDEDNISLLYQIQEFEGPQNLLRLASEPEYSRLRYPYFSEVVSLALGEDR